MQIEIERKFLLKNDGWKEAIIDHRTFRDGLIAAGETGKARVQLGEIRATLTIKSARDGIRRTEFEYEIPRAEAQAMIAACCGNRIVEKTRFYVRHGDVIWDVDIYTGNLAGIAFAEIELQDEAQIFDRPDWLGQEVTGDRRFSKQYIVGLCMDTGRCPTIPELLAMPRG